MFDLTPLDWLALAWFIMCWVGYTQYSGFNSPQSRNRLQDVLHIHIRQWVATMHARENRIVDTTIIANIERNATFLASSSLLIIAGLTTALGSSEKVDALLSDLPFASTASNHWELGIVLMLVAFIHAFFTFTWCVRQWGFASILVGSAPNAEEETSIEERRKHQEALAQIIWLAIYHFNVGLRAYYFSLALIAWFIHPIAFIAASSWVVAVLYRREFRSRTLSALRMRS